MGRRLLCMAALISIAMCGEPADQAVCGAAFDILEDRVWTVLLAVFLSVLCAKRAFRGLEGSE